MVLLKFLDNVRFVPNLRRNLISLGLLNSNGYFLKYENCVLKFLKGSLVVIKGKLVHGLCILDGIAIGDLINALDNYDETLLWHKKLG